MAGTAAALGPRLGALIAAVQKNCDIADARHARDTTLCTYLLAMREHYRWEHELPATRQPPRAELGRWLSEREAYWEGIDADDFVALPLGDARHGPFDVAAINAALKPAGLLYGAGIGRFGRPHFFLGELAASETHDGLRVDICGCEYARDLAAIPAALQGDTVVVRNEALLQWLREQAETWELKRGDGHWRRALESCGYFVDGAAALARLAARETATLILHERGEHAAGALLGPDWETMIADGASRRFELLARAVRDNWADCLATLPTLLEREAWDSLHFWCAQFDGVRRAVFPRLAAAAASWRADGDIAPLAQAAAAGCAHWQAQAHHLLALYRAGDTAALAALAHDSAPLAL